MTNDSLVDALTTRILTLEKRIEIVTAERDEADERISVLERVEPIKAHPAEARVSIIARQIRETMRGYGHKVAESSLPDWIAVDVSAALKSAEAVEERIRAEARLAQAERGPAVTEAMEELRTIFHKTRFTKNVSVPADVVYTILYGKSSRR